MSHNCTGPKTQAFFEVIREGRVYIHAQSATAQPIPRLEETNMFGRWDFYNYGPKPDPLIPKADFERMVRAIIPDYDPEKWVLSVQEIAKSKGYARPYTFFRAIDRKNTCCGSSYDFYQDSSIRATAISSLNAVDIREWTRERERENAEKCRNALMRDLRDVRISEVTSVSSSSAVRGDILNTDCSSGNL
jgi:hypothetical protein